MIKRDKDGNAITLLSEWSAEDIQWCAKGFDDSKEDILTAKECGEVLELLERKHDCSIGINWDVIDYHIKDVKEKNETQSN